MKKLWKQLCALFCAGCLLFLPACGTETGSGFPDVPESEWYYEAVTFLTGCGYISGFPDGSFQPASPLTKAQLTKLLLADTVSGLGPETCWWRPYYEAALESGILTEADEADMDLPVDRFRTSQMLAAVLMEREAERLTEIDGQLVVSLLGDVEAIPETCMEAVVTVYGLGILRGYEDGCFHGAETLTRAQGAAILQRCLVPETRTPVFRALETVREMPPEPSPEPAALSEVLFLGNSLCEGLSLYGGLTEADFLSSNGAGVYSYKQVSYTDQNREKCSLTERLPGKAYRVIVLIYGTNEMGYDIDYLRERYHEFLDMVTEAQPNADIWMTNAPPVNESILNSEQFTNKTCQKVNRLIQEVAEEREIHVIDLWSYLADSDGSLPAYKTLDGIHLTGEVYQSWMNWMLEQLPVQLP